MSFGLPEGYDYLIIGFALLALEVLSPLGVTLALGLGAVLTGGIFIFFPQSAQIQLLSFIGLSLVMLFFTRNYVRHSFTKAKAAIEGVNDPLNRFVGQTYALHMPIVNGQGTIKQGDSLWNVQGQDQSEGFVKVISVNGTLLQVVRA
jgi:inner membrane protein